MALQIPARHVSLAWEQRVDADLRFRRIEDELRLAAFLLDRIVAGDRDLSVGLAIGCDAITEHSVIDCVSERRDSQRRGESHNRQSLQEMLDSGSQQRGHGVNYTRGLGGSVLIVR